MPSKAIDQSFLNIQDVRFVLLHSLCATHNLLNYLEN